MSKFKIGDKIHYGSDRERSYTVISIDSRGWLMFEGYKCIGYNNADYYTLAEEKPTVDFTRPVTTRDGRKARILCTDRKWRTDRPIVALVEDSDGETVKTYDRFGCSSLVGKEDKDDLINPPVKKYINLFSTGASRSYFHSREAAELAAGRGCNAGYIKTIEVEL